MSARKKPRSKPRRALALALVLAAGIAACAIAGFKVANDPRFALTEVGVSGERVTPASDIVLAAALPKGANVWLLDVSSAERRIEGLPWIASANVRRAWPNTLSVAVTERSPVAKVFIPALGDGEEPGQGVALVDPAMRVLSIERLAATDSVQRKSGAHAERAAGLPLFRIVPQPTGLEPGSDLSGSNVEQAYDSMVQLRALGLHISEVDLSPVTGVTVTCDGGLHVILGSDSDLATKVNLFRAIAPKIAAPQNVVYVDLRSVRAPTVLYR